MKVDLHAAMPALGNVERNVEAVAAALATEADLVVFPELFLTGYNIGDDVQRLAFHDDDPRLGSLQEAAQEHGTHVIVGAPRSPRAGLTYNSACCIDAEGQITWVDKRALPTFTTFRERLFFAVAGQQPVWETKMGSFGIGICYDLYFPEFHKRQALEGADILVNISASPTSSRRFFETILPARAVENACFMLYSNNVGTQDGLSFWGGCQAWGPRGEQLGIQEPFEESALSVDLDLRDLRAAREFRPTIRDSDPAELDLVEQLEA